MYTTVTITVPEAKMAEASLMIYELGRADTPTGAYDRADWIDAAGNIYALSSGQWEPAQVAALRERAGVTVTVDGVPASPDRITAVVGMPGWPAAAAMGVTRLEIIDI